MSVAAAAEAVGLSTVSAYQGRKPRAWEEAKREGLAAGRPAMDRSALCFFEGRELSPGNPVRITTIDEVGAMEGKPFAPRRARMKRG